MFKCLGGDFPSSTLYLMGELTWGGNQRYSLKGNIEEIVVLPERKKKIVSFECHLKDGRKFIADADAATFQKIQVDKVSAEVPNTPNNGTLANQSKKKGIGCLIAVIVAAAFLVLTISGMDLSSSTDQAIQMIQDTTGVNEEQSAAIVEALAECEINGIDQMVYMDVLDSVDFEGAKVYLISYSGFDFISLNLTAEGMVHSICLSTGYDGTFDLYKDNQVIAKLSDFGTTDEERRNWRSRCENLITPLLKAPKTAQFPGQSEWKVKKVLGEVTVQGYVDAENSFGANIRSQFQVKFDRAGNATSLIFDGKEYME